MNKRWFSTPVFLTAWMFIFSALSTCYCAPVSFASERSAQSDLQSKMPAHCQHHSSAAKEKKSDCAPRYNTDDIERITVLIRPAQQIVNSFLSDNQASAENLNERGLLRTFSYDSKPYIDSFPPIYILVRSLLI